MQYVREKGLFLSLDHVAGNSMATLTEMENEGLGLEYLDRLTLFNERFEYDGKSHKFSEIEHIEFTALVTKHSVNLVPTGTTYSADLYLHLGGGARLRINQERKFLGAKKKQRYEAVIRAASMLMSITFDQRVELYERQLEKKNFVVWGDHQLHRKGDLFCKNQFRLNILDSGVTCLLEPFSITARKKPSGFGERLKSLVSSLDETIDLSIDKDCFLYIMKRQFGLSWASQPVPEKRKSSRQMFNESLLVLGAKLCKADGHVSVEEIKLFKKYFGIDETTFPDANKIFMEAAIGTDTGTDAAKRLSEMLSGQKEPLEYILVGLMQIADSDGTFHQAEVTFIRRIATEFAFSAFEIDRLFVIFETFKLQEKSASGRSSTSKKDTALVMNLEILGLEGTLSFSEIKSAYRELVRKHHPDLLRAQGVPIDEILIAEQMLKVINGAYEWLEKHWDLDETSAT